MSIHYDDPNADLRITPEGRAACARFIDNYRKTQAEAQQAKADKRAKFEAARLEYMRKLLGFTQRQQRREAQKVAA